MGRGLADDIGENRTQGGGGAGAAARVDARPPWVAAVAGRWGCSLGFQCCQCGIAASWQLAMVPFISHCLPMSFLVNRLKVVAVEVLDAVEELKLRTGQPLARFEL